MAAGFEHFKVRGGITGNAFAEGFHFAEEFERFLWHPVFQSMIADHHGRFHQGAGGIAQQNPVDREMYLYFEEGAVKVYISENHEFQQAAWDAWTLCAVAVGFGRGR